MEDKRGSYAQSSRGVFLDLGVGPSPKLGYHILTGTWLPQPHTVNRDLPVSCLYNIYVASFLENTKSVLLNLK